VVRPYWSVMDTSCPPSRSAAATIAA